MGVVLHGKYGKRPGVSGLERESHGLGVVVVADHAKVVRRGYKITPRYAIHDTPSIILSGEQMDELVEWWLKKEKDRVIRDGEYFNRRDVCRYCHGILPEEHERPIPENGTSPTGLHEECDKEHR